MDVLVVDDNEVVADSLAFLLGCYGHRAIVAQDGESALQLLRGGAFELVLLDEHLPGINGSAVAQSLMDRPVSPQPFVVSMTGDGDSNEDFARLFDVLLRKPFSLEALMQVIEDARAQQRCDRSPGRLDSQHNAVCCAGVRQRGLA
jgi:CheY-like chemotaxis protein